MRKSVWVVVAFCVLEVALHVITPSYWERILWLPCVSVMLVASSYVAMRAENGGFAARGERAGSHNYVPMH